MRITCFNILVLCLGMTFRIATGSDNFQFVEKVDGITTLSFQLGNFTTIQSEEHTRLVTNDGGKTVEVGLPELPVYSTLFQMETGISYDVRFEVLSSRTINDITIYPAQPINLTETASDIFEKEFDFYQTGDIYPENNLALSDPLIMRNLEMISISFTPFSYDPVAKELEVFEEVEFEIIPSGFRDVSNVAELPRSRTFEQLYEMLIINFEPPDRNEFQQPAVLYICGGGSGGAINQPYFQQLVEWRHRRGYVVYTAHTGQTGSSNTSIKNYIQDAYETFDPPPEIVGLVGDVTGAYSVPTFYESWSWYYGEGDHPYTELEGDDIFPEVLIGRLSAYNSSDLSNIINKTLHYEKALYMGDNWFEKAALIGDPSNSGISVVNTNQYIEQMMEEYEMEDIRTKYSGGNWAYWMQEQLDEGVLYFNYRGWGLFSGFTSSNIYNANNGFKNPFVTFITCGTGSFGSTSMTEDFIRAGTVASPKGGVTAIGTATLGTHTVFNNIVDMGIFEGIFSGGLEHAGGALASGHLALYNAYPSDPDYKVSMFTHWNNLMGDPALHLWTDTPTIIFAEFPETVSIGTNFVDVLIFDDDGNPVEMAMVTLVNNDDSIFISEYTDENGIATIGFDPSITGEINLTVTKRNHKPFEGSLMINDSGPAVNILTDGIEINDGSGNDNGLLNPGETVTLSIPFNNFGDESASDIQAEIISDSDHITILNDLFEVDLLNPDESITGEFEFSLSASAIENEELDLRVVITDNSENTWNSLIPLYVHGGKLIPADFQILDSEIINPGDIAEIQISLVNQGSIEITEITAVFQDLGYLIEFEDAVCQWDNIPSGETIPAFDTVTFEASSDIVNGTIFSVPIQIQSTAGYNRTEYLQLQIGEVSVTDPLGPDNYGYFIYDSGDLGYSLTHPYNWIEIDPDLGGDGTSLGMNDSGNGNPSNQQSAHVNLPFTFTMYGVDYNQISVSTNGWIGLGYTEMRTFRNYPIPGAGGPSPMIGAFWDDLQNNYGNGQVYKYIDPAEEYVIIEWSEMRTYDQNSDETFQVILYNSLTPTGDDEILIQYKEFNNTSTGDLDWGGITHGGHATIGIENHLGNDALQYSYDDIYPLAAMPLEDETALFITTRQPLALVMGDVNQDTEINILDIILIVNHVLNLSTLTPIERYIADLDQNGDINILDVIKIINLILDE